jgi:CBS domain-containing protein
LAAALHRAGNLAPLLVREGARPDAVGRIVAEVTDQVTRQIASIVAGKPASEGLCWVAMGSEARREQAFKTDQDNALILAGDDAAQVESAAHFAVAMNDGLIVCGTPECPGGFMARNPRWRLSVAGWQAQFDRWFAAPDPASALEAAVCFDMRPVWGSADLFAAVREHALAGARKHPRFLRELARQALQNTPPLGFFRGLLLERGGPHKGAFDIKKRGVMPISDLARVLALQHGVQAVNTRERLHDLRALGVMDAGFISELMDAHEFLTLLRLRHQATQVAQGEVPDNFVAPAKIGTLERVTLREAFQVIAAAQADLTERHGLGRDL